MCHLIYYYIIIYRIQIEIIREINIKNNKQLPNNKIKIKQCNKCQ
jgi:hypothetical protein